GREPAARPQAQSRDSLRRCRRGEAGLSVSVAPKRRYGATAATTVASRSAIQPAGFGSRLMTGFPDALGHAKFLFISWNHLCCQLAQRGNAWQFLTTGRLWLR